MKKSTVGFANTKREEDFYQDHIGEWVNLFPKDKDALATSGVITRYSRSDHSVILNPFLGIHYSSDGGAEWQILRKATAVDLHTVGRPEETDEGNAEGRAINYNKQLRINRLERNAKLEKLEAEAKKDSPSQ